MRQYINPNKSKTYKAKTEKVQELINCALYMLECFGVLAENSPRRMERMAIAFLACGDIKEMDDIKRAKDRNDGYFLKTRDMINFVNAHFNENISSGSYDDVRRKDLKLLTLSGIVLQSNPNSATNDSTRGYALNPIYADLVRIFGDVDWSKIVAEELKNTESLSQSLKRERTIKKVEVKLSLDSGLLLSSGEHNELQKAIIEEFLPRFGYDAKVLYVGDTTNKYLFVDREKLEELRFFEISHEELPDIIAYSDHKNWLYLIEAVHSSGPINEIRFLQLQKLTKECKADIVYVTAFMTKQKFRQFMTEIAWETEVWIADNPDHLVHFNGDKFLGPYK